MTPFAHALTDYYRDQPLSELTLHNNYGVPEIMPVEVFFRDEAELSDLEIYALHLCQGQILDVGAGVGAHALPLQAHDADVTALEISPTACQILSDRGVRKVVNDSLYSFSGESYDTLLLLMNGFGLCGELRHAPQFFNALKRRLKPGGQVIVDSSDVAYMYDVLPDTHYYGEVRFCYEYKYIVGEWFNWLYIHPDFLMSLARNHNWDGQVVFNDDSDQYLAILKPNNDD